MRCRLRRKFRTRCKVGVITGGPLNYRSGAASGGSSPRGVVKLLTGNHLCHNPRVQKEAAALAEAGFDVEVLGAWTDAALAERDRELLRCCRFRFMPVVDFATPTPAARLRHQASRIRSKAGQSAYRSLGLANRWQLGHAYPALRRAALRQPADLYIAHSEPGLAVAAGLHRRNRRVGVAMEDWFSEDLPPNARHNRPVGLLRQLEGELLADGAFASCPSRAMSRVLAQEFDCPPPTVIYNAFAWAERGSLDGLYRDRPDRGQPSIHWFSQTIGPGRGLEDLLAALSQVTHLAEIHLRGSPVAGFAAWLAERAPETWRGRIFVHGLVPNHELLSRIAEHDIGFAGEMKFCRSRDLTVTNKLLQYLLAGLAVVASDTDGQREVAEQSGEAVLLYPSGEPGALAARLNALLGSRERLARAKAAALAAAEQSFCWERQKLVLLDGVSHALAQPGAVTDKTRPGPN
jgi:glycosyltransferase involved in cell wall biosynthesis